MKNFMAFLFGVLLTALVFGLWMKLQASVKEETIAKVETSLLKIVSEKNQAIVTIKEQAVKIIALKAQLRELMQTKVSPAAQSTLSPKKAVKTLKKTNKRIIKNKTTKKNKVKKAVKKKKYSRSEYRMTLRLKQDIKILDNQIERYTQEAKNPVTFGKKIKKGWRYKQSGDFTSRINPMSTLPKSKKGIKIVYYKKAEKKQALINLYLGKVEQFKEDREYLLEKLAKLKK